MNQDSGRQRFAMFLAGWPPSVNDLTAVVHGRKIKTKRGRLFTEKVVNQIDELRDRVDVHFFKGYLRVTCTFYPPDKRTRDLDNPTKATWDAMTAAKVWEDDSQVKEYHEFWGENFKGGAVKVEIEEFADGEYRPEKL